MKNVNIQVSSAAYSSIMNERKLNVGYQKCYVIDDFNIQRCYKCCGYGHKSALCKKTQKCANCAGDHDIRECKETQQSCINCKRHNDISSKKLETNHAAHNTRICKFYHTVWEKKITKVDYPYIPAF